MAWRGVAGRGGRPAAVGGGGRAPADDATIYDLASLTKPLATAALLALLAQERRVDIDTPAAEILGGLACANGRRPTLLDLATHR